MYLRKLIREYDKSFGLFNNFKDSYKESKLIIVPFLLIVISVIGLYFTYINVNNINYKLWLMSGLLLLYGISIIWGSYLQSIFIKRKYKNQVNYEKIKLNEVNTFIKDVLEIRTVKQYEILDSIIKKEIEILEDNKKFPFANTIRQLFIAIFITGLLSYSFKELMDGDSRIGLSLLALYLMIIGSIIIVSSIFYSFKSNTKINKLKQISRLISELQLRISIVEDEVEPKKNSTNGLSKKQKSKRGY